MATNVNKIGKSELKIRICNGVFKDDKKVAKTEPTRFVVRYPVESITGVLPRQTRQIATGVGNVKFPKSAQQSVFLDVFLLLFVLCIVSRSGMDKRIFEFL